MNRSKIVYILWRVLLIIYQHVTNTGNKAYNANKELKQTKNNKVEFNNKIFVARCYAIFVFIVALDMSARMFNTPWHKEEKAKCFARRICA